MCILAMTKHQARHKHKYFKSNHCKAQIDKNYNVNKPRTRLLNVSSHMPVDICVASLYNTHICALCVDDYYTRCICPRFVYLQCRANVHI